MINDLANELLLRIFGELELTGIITSRGACQKWRSLVPCTQFLAIRRAMLEFYDELVATPLFLQTRPWVLANLKKFDRQAYLNKLLRQYPSIPEEFSYWVLEWPARATIGCCWPGLPRKMYGRDFADEINVIGGIHWLVFPQVSALMAVDKANRIVEYIPALLLHRNGQSTWLILDQRAELSGKLFLCRLGDNKVIISAEEGSADFIFYKSYPNWMAYQRWIWKLVIEAAQCRARDELPFWSKLEDIPVDNSAESFPEATAIHVPAWFRREDTEAAKVISVECARVAAL